MKKIGFIGVGIMGKSMVRNLMKAGFEVAIYTRTKAKVEDVIAEGAIWRDTVKECVADRDAVISIVVIRRMWKRCTSGRNGILKNLPKGGYAIDMTTSSPKLAVKIYETARAAGLHALDAPVTGGDGGAKAGTLTILAGGDRADFDACMPLFEAMGKNINYEGKAGNGQHTKMCNQIAIAARFPERARPWLTQMQLDWIRRPCWTPSLPERQAVAQMSNVATRILKGDLQPGFFVKHFIKDMKLADEEALAEHTKLGMLEYVLGMYEKLQEEGLGDLGTQALIKYYEK